MGRWIRRIAFGLVTLVLLVALVAWWQLRGSLPALDGELALPGLSAPVTIERDALGIVTIDAASEVDAMRALGYVHGQERPFEMDLLRRAPAGELSALFGARALDVDRRSRVHRMRARVEGAFDRIAGAQRPQLEAYADGVNAGRDALRQRPWPYLLLRRSPEPWTPADSLLVGVAMYFDLQDSTNARELAWARVGDASPPALRALLAHEGSRWDAPLAGTARGDADLPGADVVDLRRLPFPAQPYAPEYEPFVATDGAARADLRAGSNNFAVAGTLTDDGRAIVADDMHLGLRAPNLWFRARLRWPDASVPGGRVEVSGFTLPGLPAVIAGSNGHVAWGFTNSYVDTLDWQRLRPCAQPGEGGDGCTRFERHVESIAVAGGDAVAFEVDETDWGPILHREPDGSALALRWTAHLPGAMDLGLAGFARAQGVDDVLAQADRTAIPTQNLVVGDRAGNVAWRLLGPLPRRAPGCDGARISVAPGDVAKAAGVEAEGGPATAADAATTAPANVCPPWPIQANASPLLRSPTATRLWTANNRIVDGAAWARVGDGGVALGARAKQIRDALYARERHDEASLLAIQLDDRALLAVPWAGLLRDAARDGGDATPALRALADAAEGWDGRAGVDATGYRIVRAWRLAVQKRIVDGLTAPARAALGDDAPMPAFTQAEGFAWPLLEQRPAHLLPRRFACATRKAGDGCDDARDGWLALMEDAAVEVRDPLAAIGPLRERTWGERNTIAICHPLSGAIPVIGQRALCMPAQALPGDGSMPRVQAPAFGASQRMVVAPGHEARGIAHMPGGQSGHPLSPFWGAGHDDWAAGRASPFLPGEATHTLTLAP